MEAATPNSQLPPIPGKRYFTIGEVSDLCGVKTHVLRYWEQEFPSLKPMKRRGNRRYYQREDVLLIRQIRALLYEQGYTISGARQKLLDDAHNPPPAQLPLEPIVVNGHDVAPLVEELERILFILKH
jgi:DNA-binding transcriptional MerR regulator